MKVVYVLGAGFSKPAGLPLMSELIFEINALVDKGLINKDVHNKWYPVIRKLKLKKIKEILPVSFGYDLNNMEELINYLHDIPIDKLLLDNIKQSIAETLSYYTSEYKRDYEIGASKYRDTLNWINSHFNTDYYVKYSNQERETSAWDYILTFLISALGYPNDINEDVTIISFNYDLILEKYGYASIFKDKTGEGITYVVAGERKYPNSKFTLIKPNGSINTSYCRKCDCHVISDDLTESGSSCCDNCNTQMTPYIKVPGKGEETYNKGLIRDIITEKLYDADRILFIGFSLPRTDDWFKNLLMEVLIMKDRKWKAIVLCHNLNLNESGYRELTEHRCTREHIVFSVRGGHEGPLVQNVFNIRNDKYSEEMKDVHYI